MEDTEIVISTILEIQDLPKLPVMPGTIISAMKLQRQSGIGFFDALIAATMKEHGVTTIYTEDRDFEKIEGINVINPFARKQPAVNHPT